MDFNIVIIFFFILFSDKDLLKLKLFILFFKFNLFLIKLLYFVLSQYYLHSKKKKLSQKD